MAMTSANAVLPRIALISFHAIRRQTTNLEERLVARLAAPLAAFG
jgi:hypothetical protein